MTDREENLQELFSEAAPRPVPDAASAAAAHAALREEWRAAVGQQRTRQRNVRWALAASVLIGLFALTSYLGIGEPQPVRVAGVEKATGSIFVLGEQAELTSADGLTGVHSGQVMVTGEDAAVALVWLGGGSLRLHENTEIEFIDERSVLLRSGRIYFDSIPSVFADTAASHSADALQVDTPHGVVSHVGTQFMVAVTQAELTVSVREGQVDVDGRYHSVAVERGEQVRLAGRQRPVVLEISEYGEPWDWVAEVSPTVAVDGKSMHTFLVWVGRELGLAVSYESDEIETIARQDAMLKGQVDSMPLEALRHRMLTAALDWTIDEGVIYVSASE